MKKLLLSSAIAVAIIASPAAFADNGRHLGHYKHKHKKHFGDTARVTHVEPIYRTVRVNEPRRECWTEEVHYSRPQHGSNKAGGMIIGGLIGGAIGHNIEDSRNAPLVGALIGSAIGHDVAGKNRRGSTHHTVLEEHCQTVNNYYEEEQIDGYRVTYRYRGHTYTTRTDEHPGDRIKVRVSVRPDRHY